MHKLLIADDDPDLCSFLKDELTQAGFSVDAYHNGADVIVAAVEGSFDLILLDMLMPSMDGIQTIRVLRKIAPKIPVIGLTGYVGRGYMAQASDFSVVCLSKPIVMKDLLQEINETLEQNV